MMGRDQQTPPSEAATYERARRLANIAVWTVKLQHRRLRSTEPEDGEFLFRQWADFQFLIVALTRCRRAAALAAKLKPIAAEIQLAIDAFDAALPALKTMRDTAEHFDDYAQDRGRNKDISRASLEVGFVNEKRMQWLHPDRDTGEMLELDADVALEAAQQLFTALTKANWKALQR